MADDANPFAHALLLTRTLRTPHSERFLLGMAGQGGEFGACDLHYLADGTVEGTVVLFDDAGMTEAQVPALLQALDEQLLPEVRLDERTLSFSVVLGRVLGSYGKGG